MDHAPNSGLPFYRMQSADSALPVQAPRILMTHSSYHGGSQSAGAISQLTDGTLQRRTAEGVMQLRDNLNSVIRGFQPLVESARSVNAAGTMTISSLLNRPHHSEPNISIPSTSAGPSGTVVINLDNITAHNIDASADPTNTNEHINVNSEDTNENQNNIEENNRMPNTPEALQILNVAQKYLPFIIILIMKGIYDHFQGILIFILLLAVFTHSNSVVKKEATKRGRRNLSSLFCAAVYTVLCISFILCIFESEKVYLNLIFIRTFDKPLNVWDLLWIVGITDFILKLITVLLKLALTVLPGQIVAFQKRVRFIIVFIFFNLI